MSVCRTSKYEYAVREITNHAFLAISLPAQSALNILNTSDLDTRVNCE